MLVPKKNRRTVDVSSDFAESEAGHSLRQLTFKDTQYPYDDMLELCSLYYCKQLQGIKPETFYHLVIRS